MTRLTQSNAIFRSGIHLHVIYMVNMVSAFLAYRAGIVVALPNHAFELCVECGRVWSERRTSQPVRVSSPELGKPVTQKRAILALVSFCSRFLSFKVFPASLTSSYYSFLSGNIMTFHGAELTRFPRSVGKHFSALRTSIFNISTLPKVGFFSPIVNAFRSATSRTIKTSISLRWIHTVRASAILTNKRNFSALPSIPVSVFHVFIATSLRTIKRNIFAIRRDIVFFSAEFTKFLNFHAITLIRCIPFSNRHCYLGNVNRTGCV